MAFTTGFDGEWAAAQVYSSEKLKELIVYLSELSVDDRRFGATKLNKLLYFCDFWAYGMFGKSITGANYQKLPNGPAPTALVPIRIELIENNEAKLEERQYFDSIQHRLVPLRRANKELFSEDERKLIEEVFAVLLHKNATEVSELSHAQAGWDFVNENETIPYHTFFLSNEAPTEEDIQIGTEFASQHGLMIG